MARQALPPQEGSKPSRWSILKATVGDNDGPPPGTEVPNPPAGLSRCSGVSKGLYSTIWLRSLNYSGKSKKSKKINACIPKVIKNVGKKQKNKKSKVF